MTTATFPEACMLRVDPVVSSYFFSHDGKIRISFPKGNEITTTSSTSYSESRHSPTRARRDRRRSDHPYQGWGIRSAAQVAESCLTGVSSYAATVL